MELGKGYIPDTITLFAYDSNQNVEYVGEAHPGSAASDEAWQISKMIYDANQNVTEILFASGDQKFNKIWDSRAGYVYS